MNYDLAGASPVERGVRPHAAMLARRLQAAAYSHGYEDAHPANATTRQVKTDAVSRQTLADLLIAIAALGNEADRLRAELARFTPLRAKGVVDADDNLDCWDTNPYEICTRHVSALNERDPAAMWRVVDLFARDEATFAAAELVVMNEAHVQRLSVVGVA